MESILAGLALILIGLVSAFYGYRVFRILLPIYGAVLGFVVAWGWLGESAWLLALIVGVVLAVVLAIFAYAIWSVVFAISGIVFGATLAAVISTSLNLWTWLAVLLAVVLAAVFAWLFFRYRNEMVIISTGLTGASLVARGVGELFGLRGGFDAVVNPNPTWLLILMGVIWVVVAWAGIAFQWGRYRRLNWYGIGHLEPGGQPPAPAAAPASRGAVPSMGTQTVGPASGAPASAGAIVAGTAAAAAGAAAWAGASKDKTADAAAQAAGQAGSAVQGAAGGVAGATAAAAGVAAAGVSGLADKAGDVADQAGETVAEVADAAVDTAGAAAAGAAGLADNTVDQVVKEINATFSLDEIAKFREKLEFVEGIGPSYAEKLRGAGIETVLDLLRQGATRRGRAHLVEQTGIPGKLILEWVNHSDLYRIKGVGSEYADLLEAAGVDTVVELAQRNPARLLGAMQLTNKEKQLVRKEPLAYQVEDWVAQAKLLPRVIEY